MIHKLFCIILGVVVINRAAHILVHDHLNPDKPIYPFILLGPGRPCLHYNETLYPYGESSEEIKKDIYQRLKCHNGDNSHFSYYYIGTGDGQNDKDKCKALDYSTGGVVDIKCRENYPSICTSSAPKTMFNFSFSNSSRFLHSISSTYGSIMGSRTDISFVFAGIPYAFPPVNELRFEDPVCISNIVNPWDASFFRSYCVQESISEIREDVSEDCLYLNVYTPYIPDLRDTADMRLPVLLWIHGGAFVRGGSADPYNIPTHLVSSQDVVVVTANYRLGLLGFWGSRNSGIKDQVTILKWIHEHISDFGGDPNRVTIAGESAGANSVRALLVIEKIKGLFHGAYLSSDPIGIGFSTKNDAETSLMPKLAVRFSCINESQGIYDEAVMRCMRSLPISLIVQQQFDMRLISPNEPNSISSLEIYRPVIDGDLIKSSFYQAVIDSKFNHVPVLLGTLEHEGHYFVQQLIQKPMTKDAFLFFLNVLFSSEQIKLILKSGLYNEYITNVDSDGGRDTIGRILTDYVWTCPHQLATAILSRHTYVYGYHVTFSYSWLYQPGSFCHNRVCHADDIVTILGSSAIPGIEMFYDGSIKSRNSDDLSFLITFNERFGAFIRTGDPNPDVNKLCYNKKYFADNNNATIYWDPFKVDDSLGASPVSSTGISNGNIYGPLHILNIKESKSSPHGLNKTICDFWFTLGIQAQSYSKNLYTLLKFESKLLE